RLDCKSLARKHHHHAQHHAIRTRRPPRSEERNSHSQNFGRARLVAPHSNPSAPGASVADRTRAGRINNSRVAIVAVKNSYFMRVAENRALEPSPSRFIGPTVA